jgi:Ras-related protein Rab-8A
MLIWTEPTSRCVSGTQQDKNDFETITTSFFRGAHGILLVYDVTDRRSFESVRHWISQIQQHADVSVNVILIGNKCDLKDDRVVSIEEGQKLGNEFGIPFLECSAKDNLNVDEAFLEVGRAVKDRLVEGAKQGPATPKGPGLRSMPGSYMLRKLNHKGNANCC